MKLKLALFSTLVFTYSLSAQDATRDTWIDEGGNTNTGNCFVGNVGLLSTSPEMNLHINTVVPAAGSTGLNTYPINTNKAGIRFEFSNSLKTYGPLMRSYCFTPYVSEEKWDLGINRGKFFVEQLNSAVNPSNGAKRFFEINNQGVAKFRAYSNTNIILEDYGIGGLSSDRSKIGFKNNGLMFYMSGNSGATYSDALYLGSDGKVAIGTTNPADGSKLSVAGRIYAEEITVQLANAWPDYVFADEYNLKPLSEVEKFITTNHHLPEVPSANEISEEGIELGEMNGVLLRKIEELTLYMIELKNENVKLTERITELENSNR